ncbi:hypothetical protein TPHA_0J00960 [Tetrapisispora phaffii CBS 4417]|uniref:Uncharacterized protein n=1 Tax=Tetrapisispora phaffii (strain ATCC 24235 / CBS 4417 / NBRC 1672 / NRRL Y-8282 / UCD 70-5) TaxID=1071381 RepID=G8BYH6_TETPH|nr:hypothetical protein TPHA_0J00960 [Tetrapisispora phaffii CBS 4417]CCE64918.1 hypothetical protein TPHA_0J00960 [Tetrapisispora phaffii CBS 4417]
MSKYDDQLLKETYVQELSHSFETLSVITFDTDYLNKLVTLLLKSNTINIKGLSTWIRNVIFLQFAKLMPSNMKTQHLTIIKASIIESNIRAMLQIIESHCNYLETSLGINNLGHELNSKILSSFNEVISKNYNTFSESLKVEIDNYINSLDSLSSNKFYAIIDFSVEYHILNQDNVDKFLNRSLNVKGLNSKLPFVAEAMMWKRRLEIFEYLYQINLIPSIYPAYSNYNIIFKGFFNDISLTKLSQHDIGTLLFSGMNIDDPLIQLFVKSRCITQDKNIDILLHSIYLIDPYIADIGEDVENKISMHNQVLVDKIIQLLRSTYANSMMLEEDDIHQRFNLFLNSQYKENYNILKDGASPTNPYLMELCESIPSFIFHYMPYPEVYFEKYYLPSLFRRILMLNDSFPRLFKDKRCLENQILTYVNNYYKANPNTNIFINIKRIFSLIDVASTSFINHPQKLVGLSLNTLILKESIYRETDIHKINDSICWPNQELQNIWDTIKDRYQKEGKILKNSASYHIIETSTPFKLSNGDTMRLITNLTMASILQLFNDNLNLTQQAIQLALIKDTNSKYCFSGEIDTNLKKLAKRGILAYNKTFKTYSINNTFKPGPKTEQTGRLRCF